MTSDMRMNGSCAGGTGAFIDEIATLLGVKTEEFETLRQKVQLYMTYQEDVVYLQRQIYSHY